MKLNKKRINKLIKALKTEAGQKMFDLSTYISEWGKPVEEAFLGKGNCGTTACIAGFAYIVDPEFFIFDKTNGDIGLDYILARDEPSLGTISAVAKWLNISYADADDICMPGSRLWEHRDEDSVEDAIEMLEAYRDGGIKKAELV